MIKIKTVITSILLSAVMCVQAQQAIYSRATVYLDAVHDIAKLAGLGVDVEHGIYRSGVSFEGEFRQADLVSMQSAGFKYDIEIADMSAYYQQRNSQRSSASGSRAVGCYNKDILDSEVPTHFHGGSMGGFLTYQEMLTVLDSMRILYPQYITAKQQIDTFNSVEGRPIYWVRISNHADTAATGRPQILYTSLHHAREPAGLTNMLYYVWHLLENYQRSAEVKALLDNTELYFIPCVNPDGYAYNQTTNPNGGGMWRKNRRDNLDGTFGIDLNRNYGYNWGYDNTGSSPLTSSETYRGPSAFSEPETRAVKWLCDHHSFRIAINYHTYSNDLIYPWGYQLSYHTPDSTLYDKYATLMCKNDGYKFGTSDQTIGYGTNGDSDDWMYGERGTKSKILAMTPEAGSQAQGFWPPATDVTSIAKENFYLISYAHRFLLRYLQVKDLTSKVITQKNFWFKYEAQRIGLDSPGTYTIRIISNDPNVTAPATVKTITNPAMEAPYSDSVLISLSGAITNGTNFSFVVQVDNGQYSYGDTIRKVFITGDTLYYNNCNSISDFIPSGTWGVTSATSTSGGVSITDSPNGNYQDMTSSTFNLTKSVDLHAVTSATLLMQSRWDLESGYDYVYVEASTDRVTWNALCGPYSSLSVNGVPGYTGTQKNWVQEAMSLDSYAGGKVYLRFNLMSDQATNADGFYFDDLTVLGRKDSAAHTTGIMDAQVDGKWHIYPNPSANVINVSPVALNGEQVKVMSTLGAVVSELTVSHEQLDISTLAPGIYYLSVNKNGYTRACQKLVIAR